MTPAEKFTVWMFEETFDSLEIDGGYIQDKMVELGLIELKSTQPDDEWVEEVKAYYPTKYMREILEASDEDE